MSMWVVCLLLFLPALLEQGLQTFPRKAWMVTGFGVWTVRAVTAIRLSHDCRKAAALSMNTDSQHNFIKTQAGSGPAGLTGRRQPLGSDRPLRPETREKY